MRREHIRRVRDLIGGWGQALQLPTSELNRWLASATLHDALRDADPADFVAEAIHPADVGHRWPRHLLHGPACAHRLLEEGVTDKALLMAVAYHTTGHAGLDEMGEYLYLADFLDPGRDFMHEKRQTLRERLPGEQSAVLLEVIGLRIGHLLKRRSTILEETLGFWNRVAGETERA